MKTKLLFSLGIVVLLGFAMHDVGMAQEGPVGFYGYVTYGVNNNPVAFQSVTAKKGDIPNCATARTTQSGSYAITYQDLMATCGHGDYVLVVDYYIGAQRYYGSAPGTLDHTGGGVVNIIVYPMDDPTSSPGQ